MKSTNWSPTVAVLVACGVSQAFADSATADATTDSAAPMVEEMMVLASYTPMENATDVERQSSEIVDAVDADQLAKFGDSNVAAAAKRVAGVSINDDKYVVLRGLDGRYVSATLNGNLMPTTDPLRRDVQLDLFPSNILKNIQIQKSYSVDLPGTTTGGSLGMATKGLPDERVTKLSVSGGYNFDVTGSDIVSYEGSGTDWLTYDDGFRDLPAEVNSAYDGTSGYPVNVCDGFGCDVSFEDAGRLGQQFPTSYNIENKSASPDWSVGVSHGNRIESGLGSFGYYASGYLGNKTSARIDAQFSTGDKIGTYNRSKESAKLGGYLVLGFEDNHDGEWLSKTILLRQSENVTKVEDGYNNYSEQNYKQATLRWNERQFLSQQFSGKHFFFSTHELEWRAAVSQTTMDEPDRKSWTYSENRLITSSSERRFSELTEDSNDFGLSYLMPVDFSTNISTAFKAGYLYNTRERSWDIARFRFVDHPAVNALPPIDKTLTPDELLSPENLECRDVGGELCAAYFYLQKSTVSTDSFNSDIETTAYYFNTETTFGSAWKLVAGVRQEDNFIELYYPYRNSSDPARDYSTLDVSDTLPALSLSFTPSDYWQFRLSSSQTISLPGVIERSEASLLDPETDTRIFGNPDLQPATIDNLDFRVEYYFDDGGSISLALFNKTINDPIEKTLENASGSAADGYTFNNATSADLSGVEIDFSKVLMETGSIAIDVGGNMSFIESEVTLDAASLALEGADAQGRELQGQSPFLFNAQVGFEHLASQQQVNLLVNYFDDKIFAVGKGIYVDNEYESGQVSLDLTYSKTFLNESVVKVKLSNILNSETERTQNGAVTESYKEGTELQIGYSYSF